MSEERHNRRFSFLVMSGSLVCALVISCAYAEQSPELVKEARYTMGTILEISLLPPQGRNGREILDKSFTIVQELDALLSTYKLESELSRFNTQGRLEKPSPLFVDFLTQSHALISATENAFTPAIRPLVEVWMHAGETQSLPSKKVLQKAMRCIKSWPSIDTTGALVSPCKGLQLESGGIGKGYAVDRVVEYLRTEQVKSALINFGRSSTYALGSKPDGSPWKLLVQFEDEPPLGEIALVDQALSASDSLGQSTVIAGKRYGHIIDPSTGEAITKKVQAVVVTLRATDAEAYSKYVVLRGDKIKGKSTTLPFVVWYQDSVLRTQNTTLRKLTE